MTDFGRSWQKIILIRIADDNAETHKLGKFKFVQFEIIATINSYFEDLDSGGKKEEKNTSTLEHHWNKGD